MNSHSQRRSVDTVQERDRLRREILAARVTVTFNEVLKRETPSPVKRLAGMKLPQMYEQPDRSQARDRLRREIMAARVTVSFNEALNRETPGPVKRLADMELPRMPILR